MTLAIGDVSPYGVEGASADTVGRLAEAMGCLGALVSGDMRGQADGAMGGGPAPGL